MVNSMWRRSLLDIRVRRGTDANSAHHLVNAEVRLKLRAAGPNKHATLDMTSEDYKTLALKMPLSYS